MLKGVSAYVLALGLLFGINAHANAMEPGGKAVLGGYCADEESARELSAAFTRSKKEAFRVLLNPKNHCLHIAIHHNKPIGVIVKEKVWTVKTYDNVVQEWFTFEDGIGQTGWTWDIVEKQPGQDS